MELNQAIKFVRQFQREHKLATIKDAIYELGAIAHLLPLDLYVAKDVVSWGWSTHSHVLPTISEGAIPSNFFFAP